MSRNLAAKKFNKNWKGILLFLLPALALYGLFFIYPLVSVVFTSLTDWANFKALHVFLGD
jgi:ABC-type sugar transport system permease subunit